MFVPRVNGLPVDNVTTLPVENVGKVPPPAFTKYEVATPATPDEKPDSEKGTV